MEYHHPYHWDRYNQALAVEKHNHNQHRDTDIHPQAVESRYPDISPDNVHLEWEGLENHPHSYKIP
jgi:hypothetical protein